MSNRQAKISVQSPLSSAPPKCGLDVDSVYWEVVSQCFKKQINVDGGSPSSQEEVRKERWERSKTSILVCPHQSHLQVASLLSVQKALCRIWELLVWEAVDTWKVERVERNRSWWKAASDHRVPRHWARTPLFFFVWWWVFPHRLRCSPLACLAEHCFLHLSGFILLLI